MGKNMSASILVLGASAAAAALLVWRYRARRRTLVGLSVVVRHGARAPNKHEMKVFTSTSPVREQWHHGDGRPADYEVENNLTDVGRAQMRAIGQWLAAHAQYGQLLRTLQLEWHSSSAERCVESGALVGSGIVACGTAAAPLRWPHKPITYDPDFVFRAWALKGTAYRKFVDALPDTEPFKRRARRSYAQLWAAMEKLGGVRASETDVLMWSTYVHLMSECEAYSDPLQPGGRKTALHTALDQSARRNLEEEACWVWERRFQGCTEHAQFLGEALWQLLGAPCTRVRLFSGHDYTILALMAYLGLRRYELPAVGYGAMLLVEHRADGSARMLLNAQPFRDATSAAVTESVCANERVLAEKGVDGTITLAAGLATSSALPCGAWTHRNRRASEA